MFLSRGSGEASSLKLVQVVCQICLLFGLWGGDAHCLAGCQLELLSVLNAATFLASGS